LDKANPNTGNIRGLNLAAVKPTTVHVTNCRYSIIGDKKCIIYCTLPGLTEAMYILFVVCFMYCVYICTVNMLQFLTRATTNDK
jgi:hypothetical protein